MLLIDGDAGIGKSSLVAEAAHRAHVQLMWGRSAHIGGLAGEVLPAVLSDLISSDLAGSDRHSRDLLGVVAAIGRESSHELLVEVSGLDDSIVEAGIRAAIEAHLVVVDDDTEAYRFRHALIGEVLYAELLPSERKRLHRRVADVIVGRGPTSAIDVVGELAFHLDRAGDRAAAFQALLVAADAAERFAPAVALRQLDRALALWDEVGEAAAGMNRAHRMWQAAELASGIVGNARAAELAHRRDQPPAPVALSIRGICVIARRSLRV